MAYIYKHGDRPLEGYEIQRGVGRGGFGEVYYAISDGGREVALKYLRDHPEVELRGIQQCINLKSPHLVSIFDVKQNKEGEYFVIMEYISGPSLRDLLIAEPRGLGVQKAAFFVREMGKGLSYLHDRGIVHRDLKPGNIFYEDGYVKIGDYGLSKYISTSRHSAQTSSVGTVHYMAPEVGSGNYSKTIDIYALGVMLYEMLLGRVPYEGASMGEVLMKHLTQQPEVDQLPQPFADVIHRCLAKDPKDRYQDVNHMVEAIFGVEDIQRSVMGFEPASLTMVAGRVGQDVRPSPAPSGPFAPRANPVPQMRGSGTKSGEEFSKRFVERTLGLDVHMTKEETRQAKRKNKSKKSKSRQKAEEIKIDQDAGITRSTYPIGKGRRLARLFAALLVAGVLALAIGVLSGSPEVGGISLGFIMTAVVGIGIGSRIATWLGPDHPNLLGRILIFMFAAPSAAIVYGAFQEDRLLEQVFNIKPVHNMFIPVLVVLGLIDWRSRIQSGQRGTLGIWEAMIPAGFTYAGAHVLLRGKIPDEIPYLLAGLMGSVSIALQAFSWALIRNPRSADDDPPASAQPVADLAESFNPDATLPQEVFNNRLNLTGAKGCQQAVMIKIDTENPQLTTAPQVISLKQAQEAARLNQFVLPVGGERGARNPEQRCRSWWAPLIAFLIGIFAVVGVSRDKTFDRSLSSGDESIRTSKVISQVSSAVRSGKVSVVEFPQVSSTPSAPQDSSHGTRPGMTWSLRSSGSRLAGMVIAAACGLYIIRWFMRSLSKPSAVTSAHS